MPPRKRPNKKSPATAPKKNVTSKAAKAVAQICCRECLNAKLNELPGTSASAAAANAATADAKEQSSSTVAICQTENNVDAVEASSSPSGIQKPMIVRAISVMSGWFAKSETSVKSHIRTSPELMESMESNISLGLPDMSEDGQRPPKRRRVEPKHECDSKNCMKCLENKKKNELLKDCFEPSKSEGAEDSDVESI
ncbi:uncharacterized protein [Drosophila pseudoobscura]|uniref:Uncharacterized protein n=1 Tax=Drosophila pseudoobscura pseudoobscura TaxID=46245 RepID=A0A6I8VZG3_DROPS|nr:uncharacterized protein LOC117184159 [Drosophila pseudoobscura]